MPKPIQILEYLGLEGSLLGYLDPFMDSMPANDNMTMTWTPGIDTRLRCVFASCRADGAWRVYVPWTPYPGWKMPRV